MTSSPAGDPAGPGAQALALLKGWRPAYVDRPDGPDGGQERLRRRFIAHLEAQPDGLRRDCVPDHLTASTLIVSADHAQVLLTLHAKAGSWFQMGGHCEDADAGLREAALREATEESGVHGLALDPNPVHLDAHEVTFCVSGRTVTHLDVRFLAVAPDSPSPAASRESLEVAWWPIDAPPTTEPGLVELVELARERLAGLSR